MQIDAIISGEAGLAGVQHLLHSSSTQQMLCNQVETLLSPTVTLKKCALLRAKVKPQRKITAYYNLSLLDHSTGQTAQRAMAVTWAMASKARPWKADEDITVALEATAVETGVAAPFHRLHTQVSPGQAWLQLSPLDESFPQLLAAVDPKRVAQMIKSAIPAAYADSPQNDLCTERQAPPSGDQRAPRSAAPVPLPNAYQISTVRYRPRQRHVLAYRPHGLLPDGALSGHYYAKLYQHSDREIIRNVAMWVQDQLKAGVEKVSALTPAAWVDEAQLALYAAVPGEPLSQLLMRSATSSEFFHRAGAALRCIHNASVQGLPALPSKAFADEIKAIRRAGEHLSALAPHLHERLQVLLARVEARHATMGAPECTFTHRDFKADHLLVAAGNLILIDFDSCALGDPALDVGKFWADLYWWESLGGAFKRREAEAAFLTGYDADAHPERLARARCYRLLWLIKNCLRRFNQFDAHWLAQNEALFDLAENLESQLCAFPG